MTEVTEVNDPQPEQPINPAAGRRWTLQEDRRALMTPDRTTPQAVGPAALPEFIPAAKQEKLGHEC